MAKQTENKMETETKILFLHGLGSRPYADRTAIMKGWTTHVFSPHIDYFLKDGVYIAESIIAEEGITHIAGHSMGGLIAHYLSNRHRIPALMFNPAFGSLNAPKILGLGSEYGVSFGRQYAVVGMMDDVIPPDVQMAHLGHATVWQVEDMPHTIPPWYFEEYFDKFMEIEKLKDGD